jgi:hypothetical protein
MPDPNPHDMLTRIEIQERRVQTLERAATITKRRIPLTKLVLATLLLLAAVAPARAQTMCTTYGNQTFCTSAGGSSVICTTYGNQTICN